MTWRTLGMGALTFFTLGACLAKATLGPPAGEYLCTTVSITVGTGPSVNPAGIAPLATQVLPSALGTLVLDGKGGYRFPKLISHEGKPASGTYRFDAKTGTFAFSSGVFKTQKVRYETSHLDSRTVAHRIVITLEKNQGTHSCALTRAVASPASSIGSRRNGGFVGTIAFERERGTITTLDLASGKVRQRVPGRRPMARPGGGALALREEQADLSDALLVLIGGARVRKIRSGLQSASTPIALSPDGRLLALTSWETDPDGAKNALPEGSLAILDDAGRRLALLFGAAIDETPCWLEGERVAFVAQDGSLAVVNRDGTGRKTLLTGSVRRPAASPDGKTIAFLRDGALWRVGADGTGPKKLASPGRNPVNALTFSPDGKALLVATASSRESLWIVPLDGGEPLPLSDDTDSGIPCEPDSTLAWLPAR